MHWLTRNANHFILPMLLLYNAISIYAYMTRRKRLRGDTIAKMNRFVQGLAIVSICFGGLILGILITRI
jgi:hypothetical protein